ncbi:hypothetical protein [Paenibacillus sp. N3.4]|uniref:hypothetical protein n=1 Tax=Paenibacillus sp. N3.4 TaxID=2603222 RepID=UPI0011C768CE|nr:hypothetical protein [Paenibacillus sp. N3.4]TXK72423.1 hypothetical protein FU659_31130 [Paenibacillus sp. N3.4]
MTTLHETNTFDHHMRELKTTHAFDQVVFARSNDYFVYFEGLKSGVIVEIRYNIEANRYEASDYSKWLPL